MTKKSLYFLSFPKTWSAFIIGMAMGIASQHVPELRSYTENLATRLSKSVEENVSFDHLQEVFFKKRGKRQTNIQY